MDVDRLMRMPPRVTRQEYGVRDTILYALGVGAGIEPVDLPFIFEKDIETLATMAVVLASPGFWIREPEFAVDWRRALHAEQMLTVHKPLQHAGRVTSELRIDEIFDKGRPTGALLYSSRRLYDEATGDLLASLRQSSMLRGDGGCGGSREQSPRPAALPVRPPDLSIDLATRPEQALIYRLSGDYNPLHADPRVASEAGFPRPILHGLCTYGVAGRALTRAIRSIGARHMTQMDVRFVTPVFPGETIRTHVWWEANRAMFRCDAVERNVVALDHGIVEFE